MEPKLVARDKFTVMGIQERFTPETEDFGGIWKRFMAHHDLLHGLSTDKAYYGVCFGTEQDCAMDYLAGMAVPAGTRPPEGLVLREVSAARYAVFECTVKTIHETYEFIHGTWVAKSPYAYDRPKPDFEQYAPGTDSGDSPVFIHIPIRERHDE